MIQQIYLYTKAKQLEGFSLSRCASEQLHYENKPALERNNLPIISQGHVA